MIPMAQELLAITLDKQNQKMMISLVPKTFMLLILMVLIMLIQKIMLAIFP